MNAEKNSILPSHLYLVGTPIGNLSDISERALKALSEADFIAAEDTRVTGRLLAYFGIKKELVSYYEQNRVTKGEAILARLTAGESCALVTDAGMPSVSDPGEDLVRLCIDNGIPVTCVPGPTALITALALSGISSRSFCFEGFLPRETKERREKLEIAVSLPSTVIIYESPFRVADTLKELAEIIPERQCAVCRELTKLNEEILRSDIRTAAQLFSEKEARGEFVIVIEGIGDEQYLSNLHSNSARSADPYDVFIARVGEGMTKSEAVKAAAKDCGISRNDMYQLVLDKEKHNE